MTFGSLFSGIGGFDLGFERAGMQCLWQVECDQNCNRVLSHQWPNVTRHEDVRTFNGTTNTVRPALVCGGFPCQDLSVAGRRAGLAGERSGLFFQFMRIVGELSPAWVVIENVPGLLSSNGGRDMGAVLGALAKLGYGFAYRILDAQWFGVAQRRRRVFIVGCLGDWRRAAEVLFERESLPWDTPPSRETGSRASRCIARGTGSSGYRYDANGEDFVTGYTELGEGHATFQESFISGSVRGTGGGAINSNLAVAHALSSEGADASEDGTGRETPLVFATTYARNGRGAPSDVSPCLEHGGAGSRIDRRPTLFGQTGVRRLTTVECSRLQGFPDSWLDCGLSDSAKYRALGNAVCVPVAEWIGRRIMQATEPGE